MKEDILKILEQKDYCTHTIKQGEIYIVSKISTMYIGEEVIKELMGGNEAYQDYINICSVNKEELEEIKKLARINYYKRQIQELENDLNYS